ncbi:MAG: XdhC family protein [Siphonobacter aquaeclarae]|nr:XdhC family protein [Siphonobacter aquaeclarae]
MKEIRTILERYSQLDFTQTKAALATVVRVEGSSYRRVGARMLVTEDGQWVGGISGGCLEGDALKRARLAMASGVPALVTYDTTDDDPYQIGVGLGCNGIIDVLLAPLSPDDTQNAVRQLEMLPGRRESTVVLTVVRGGALTGRVFLFPDEASFRETFPRADLSDILVEHIHQHLQSGRSGIAEAGDLSVLLEVVPPPIHLFIHGGNYDIFPLVRLAREIGWLTTVFCNTLKINQVIFDWADEVVAKDTIRPVDAHTAVLLMAHDFETDFRNFDRYRCEALPYIGLLGPRKRFEKIISRLAENGEKIADESHIYSPVGLDTGASTPEEIAVAILAEIRSVFSGRGGGLLRKRVGPIYGDESVSEIR